MHLPDIKQRKHNQKGRKRPIRKASEHLNIYCKYCWNVSMSLHNVLELPVVLDLILQLFRLGNFAFLSRTNQDRNKLLNADISFSPIKLRHKVIKKFATSKSFYSLTVFNIFSKKMRGCDHIPLDNSEIHQNYFCKSLSLKLVLMAVVLKLVGSVEPNRCHASIHRTLNYNQERIQKILEGGCSFKLG